MDLQEKIFDKADNLLAAGKQPAAALIAEQLQLTVEEVETVLADWWEQVPTRLIKPAAPVILPDVPEVLGQAFARIWQQALQEAGSQYVVEKHSQNIGLDEVRREADESLQQSKGKLLDLEGKLREQTGKTEEIQSQVKGYEAEIGVLKQSLMTETTLRKQEEQARLNLEQELNHLRKTHDDTKRTFDQRIKDEQRHSLDAVSKAEADVRYYRNALEKLRDEVGKKESALTKSIHDLQAELARKDVKSDTQKTQIKSLEEELKKIKLDSSTRSRDLSKLNTSLLSETNKNKRLEDKLKELEEELKKARQKQVTLASEHARREASIRNQYKGKDEELVRAMARIAALEKKVITQDEEVRRLNSHL
ncbi:DNA-binding protein [Neptuniibacter halophilus]|uniref:DNA-binding protein n=1 Tax=Neptuniibacter halophilus TaxID=651666 RepID=UPI0025739005|nr:DNA-binding protein [Neptuniibacter halophilus]